MQISKRLQRVAAQVQQGGVVADIGCDHGFTSIYLIENGLAEHAIAMDINPGPLERAREHICQYGMEEKIAVRLSDGAAELLPGEADCLLISGMGGGLICKILQASRSVVEQVRELVLSPQSEIFLVRHLLHEMGFIIDREEMIVDQGKYYVILHAVPGSQHFLREEEYIYGKYLIDGKDKVLLNFLQEEILRIDRILQGMEGQRLSETAQKQQKALQEKNRQIHWTMDRMGLNM